MRWLVVVLLLANVLYFGWELDRQTSIDLYNSPEPLPVPAGVERLLLIRELKEPPAPGHSEEMSGSSTAVAGGEMIQEDISEGPDQPAMDVMIEEEFVRNLVTQLPGISIPGIPDDVQAPRTLCFSYGPFPDEWQKNDLLAWFEQRQIPVQQRLESEQEHKLFWIYLAPGNSRDSAMEAIEDLKMKGVTDYRLIETGDMRNAISLGLFSTQASVNRRLNELKDKGYQPIVVPHRGTQVVYWVDVKLTGQEDVLNAMIHEYPARFNSVPVRCDQIALL
jgi:hypothetical protein